MSDRYVAMYHGIDGLLQEDAEVLEEEGIDFEIKGGGEIDKEHVTLPPFEGDGLLVFPDRDEAERAAEFVKVIDVTKGTDRQLDGATRLRT